MLTLSRFLILGRLITLKSNRLFYRSETSPYGNLHATDDQNTNVLNGTGSIVRDNSKAQQNLRPQTEPSS